VPLKRALRPLFLYWAFGLLALALMWCVPLTRRLAAGLVRLAIVVIAPALPASAAHDRAEPTWMFVLCIGVAGAVLGVVFFGARRLVRKGVESRKS
jgi:hypothetical protein